MINSTRIKTAPYKVSSIESKTELTRSKVLKLKEKAWREYHQIERFTFRVYNLSEDAIYQEDVLDSQNIPERVIAKSFREPTTACWGLLEKLGMIILLWRI